MESSSSSSSSSSNENESVHLVDDFYFSALHDVDEIFPISDEKYAEELQLQEALMSSLTPSIPINQSPNNFNTSKKLRLKKIETGESSESLCLVCMICMDTKSAEEMFRINTCTHIYCNECISQYVETKIQENITMVKCPEPKCKGVLEPQFCNSIIPKEVFDRWENALCESLVMGSQKFYCPFKDCSAMLVDDGDEVVTASECPNCRRMFCAQCRVTWHAGIGCREFQNLSKEEREIEDKMVMELAKNKEWRRCPNCRFYVEKISGCTHINCRCGFQFCYGCGSYWNRSHACPSN